MVRLPDLSHTFSKVAAVAVAIFSILKPAALQASDNADTAPDSTESNTFWIHQLIDNGFHINDPDVRYPKFPRFALNVYNWGDRTFNSYDSTYVVATGKNWKTQLKNENWMRTYMMQLSDKSTVHITSKLYYDLGAYVSFMAVTLGYSFNLNSFMGDNTKRHRFDLNFTCSRFAFNFWTQKVNGGTVIRKFGDYKDGDHLNYPFNDLDVADSHLELYYFFNNRQYSQAAAYCFSKYQLKSAGSWILGISYDRHNLRLDFSSLPQAMLDALPTLQREYHMRHTDYCVLGGYAHNWVLKPRKWLINLTTLPFIGYKHSSTTDHPDRDIRNMISLNITGMGSVVYNHRALYAAAQARVNGFFNMSADYTFFTSNQIITLIAGFRF